MKGKTKWAKLCSILLCCVMLVGLLPTVAFAEGETTTIDRIDVTGVTPPFVGAMPTITGLSLGEGVDINESDTFWVMKQGDKYSDMVGGTAVDNLPFKAGEKYALNINTYLEEGYTFAEGIKVYYNGTELPVWSKGLDADASCYEIDEDYLWAWIGFGELEEREPQEIDSLTVTGVTPPAIGAMPTISGLSLGEGVYIDTLNTFWVMKQGDDYSDMVGDTSVDNLPFKAGEKYALNINAYLKAGYTLAEGIKVYYNGTELPVWSKELDTDASCYEIDGDYLWVWIGFDALTEDGHTHEYGAWTPDDETTHSKECACTDKITEAHRFTWVIDKEATATEKGAKHEECTACGYRKAAVEIPATGSGTGTATPTDPTTPSSPSKPAQTNPDTGAASPQTGDSAQLALWIVLLAAGVCGMVGTAVYSRRKRVG